MSKSNYDESNIQVLEGLDPVRKRPGMYIGTVTSTGLHHLVWEIVDNSVDEALAGYCTEIFIEIEKNNVISVSDNGRGIPTGIHEKTGKSTLETIFTVLHAGGKFDGAGYKVSGGLHGVGASVVNALSEWLEVNVFRDGKQWSQKFARGEVITSAEIVGDTDKSGTNVKFKPDAEIFKETQEFDYFIIEKRVKELAFLNKGIKLNLKDSRFDEITEKEFYFEGGISEYVNEISKKEKLIHEEVIYFEEETDDIVVEVALQYNTSYKTNILTFANNINTHEGGTHDQGFRTALTRTINNYAKNNIKNHKEAFVGDDVREGIVAVISIKHPDPLFEGQTKTKLGNSEVRTIVEKSTYEKFSRFLMENPNVAKQVVDKANLARSARIASKNAREATRRKNVLEFSTLPGKLWDCSTKDTSISELFIVEGDSAGGSAKGARDSSFQAILPVKGKVLNVEKSSTKRIFDNEEIRAIFSAIGVQYGEKIDINKLRYSKIIIMTDADVDGAHIRTLLLTLFFRYLKPLIDNGNIYFSKPPLYGLLHGKRLQYCHNEELLNMAISRLPEDSKYSINRYKGLGEMNEEDLWETTMDPESRVCNKVTIEDAEYANEIFTVLMGEDVEMRKKFIQDNAKNVKNLDI